MVQFEDTVIVNQSSSQNQVRYLSFCALGFGYNQHQSFSITENKKDALLLMVLCTRIKYKMWDDQVFRSLDIWLFCVITQQGSTKTSSTSLTAGSISLLTPLSKLTILTIGQLVYFINSVEYRWNYLKIETYRKITKRLTMYYPLRWNKWRSKAFPALI